MTFDEEGAKISRSGTIGAVAEVERGLFVIKQYRESASEMKASTLGISVLAIEIVMLS